MMLAYQRGTKRAPVRPERYHDYMLRFGGSYTSQFAVRRGSVFALPFRKLDGGRLTPTSHVTVNQLRFSSAFAKFIDIVKVTSRV